MQNFNLNSILILNFSTLLVILLTMLHVTSYAQNQKPEFSTLKFEQLDSLQYALERRSSYDSLRTVSSIQYEMAKAMNDSVKMARSLFYRCRIEKKELALTLADSIIQLSINSDSKYYPAIGYDLKGTIYYKNDRYSEALKHFLTANDIARKRGNTSLSLSTLMSIAAIKNMNGYHTEAIDIYTKALNEIIPKPINNRFYARYQRLYKNIGLGYMRQMQLDSSLIYFKKGIETARQFNDSTRYIDFVMIQAQNDYHSGKFTNSRDSIAKYIDQLEPPNLAERLYYLARSSHELDSTQSLIPNFQKIDSLSNISNIPVDNFNFVYKTLIEDAIINQSEVDQILYIDKLLKFDSLRRSENSKTKNMLPVAFDIPFLKREKKELQNQLKSRSKLISQFVIISILLFGLVTFFSIRFLIVNKKVKELMISRIEPIASIKPEGQSLEIDLKIVTKIRRDLEYFEESNGFLDPSITLSTLASTLNTNTTYLSQVINYYKKINFSTYLKDLRVTHAINILNGNPALSSKYTLSGLAEMFGFKSSNSFSKAIKEKVKVSAASYLRRLREKHNDL